MCSKHINHSRLNWQHNWEDAYDSFKRTDQLACLICTPFMLNFNIENVFINWQVLCIEKKSTYASHVCYEVKFAKHNVPMCFRVCGKFKCGCQFSLCGPRYLMFSLNVDTQKNTQKCSHTKSWVDSMTTSFNVVLKHS